jgi:hypothetical protein
MTYSIPKIRYSRSRGSNERRSNYIWKKRKRKYYEPEHNFWSVIKMKNINTTS